MTTLLLSQPERLRDILLNAERPVQLVFAGKAHPADDMGKEMIRQIVQFSRRPELRNHVAFLEDYDIEVARTLYQGCDVWLNTPRRPLEACGTSGEKAALNGALNCSVLDGWWDEYFDTEIGWAILSAESQASMQPLWQPLLDDMSKSIGVPVKPYFATNYTALVEAMRFGQVQAGWFSARPALEAVNRADAEVLSRVLDAGGEATYRSVLIVRKGSKITLDDVLKCDRKLSLGIGDAQSTSGTLAPMTYLFTPRAIEPAITRNSCGRSVPSDLAIGK